MKNIYWDVSVPYNFGILPEYVILDNTDYQINLIKSEFLAFSGHLELYSEGIEIDNPFVGCDDLVYEADGVEFTSNVLIAGMSAGLAVAYGENQQVHFYLGLRKAFVDAYPNLALQLMTYVEKKLEPMGIKYRNDAYMEFRKSHGLDLEIKPKVKKLEN